MKYKIIYRYEDNEDIEKIIDELHLDWYIKNTNIKKMIKIND